MATNMALRTFLAVYLCVACVFDAAMTSFIPMHPTSCDLDLPVDGCTCWKDPDLFVSCKNLALSEMPHFNNLNASNVHTLDISGNLFGILYGDAFKSLEIYELLMSGCTRSHTDIDVDFFNEHQARSIRVLDISNGGFYRVPGFIMKLIRLQKLNLKGNNILNLNNNDFVGFRYLTDLHLGEVRSLESAVFANTKDLKLLEMNPNAGSVFNAEAGYFFNYRILTRLARLETLILYSGTIKLDPTFLGSLSRLINLEVTQCMIYDEQLEQGSLDNRHNTMKHLDFDNNALHAVPVRFLRNLGALETLYLSNNVMERVTSNAFDRNPLLTHINLRSNMLTAIDVDAFAGLNHLRELDLSRNKLTSLASAVFPDQFMTDIAIYIGFNALWCDCNILWLIETCKRQRRGEPGPLDVYEIENEMFCYDNTHFSIRIYSVHDVSNATCHDV